MRPPKGLNPARRKIGISRVRAIPYEYRPPVPWCQNSGAAGFMDASACLRKSRYERRAAHTLSERGRCRDLKNFVPRISSISSLLLRIPVSRTKITTLATRTLATRMAAEIKPGRAVRAIHNSAEYSRLCVACMRHAPVTLSLDSCRNQKQPGIATLTDTYATPRYATQCGVSSNSVVRLRKPTARR